MEVAIVLGLPLAGSFLLALAGHRGWAPELNATMSFTTFFAAILLTARVVADGPLLALDEQFFVDPFNVFLVALTAFVGFTTSLFSRPYMRAEQERGRVSAGRLRLYHSMYQLFMFTMFLCLLSNNVGAMWVAMEGATLSTVLLVSLYRTPASLEAAWKYFILCSVGIAQALFGTILLYFAAEKVLGPGGTSLLWTHLHQVRGQLEPTVLSLAFVFLLVGYGTKVGLVPLHNWLPDAHAEGPTPISAVLSGLLLNVALYAVVRSKVLVDGALGSLAILGMPPFGVFTSEFMVLTTAMHEHSWATPFLLVALGVAFASIFGKVQPMVFGETAAQRLPRGPALLPVFAHLAIVLTLGLYIPPYLVGWYRQAAAPIGWS